MQISKQSRTLQLQPENTISYDNMTEPSSSSDDDFIEFAQVQTSLEQHFEETFEQGNDKENALQNNIDQNHLQIDAKSPEDMSEDELTEFALKMSLDPHGLENLEQDDDKEHELQTFDQNQLKIDAKSPEAMSKGEITEISLQTSLEPQHSETLETQDMQENVSVTVERNTLNDKTE